MKSKTLASGVRTLAIFLSISSTCALAQERRPPIHLGGLINDYTPSTVKGGPWEMHGQWTLDIREDWQSESGLVGDFSADMTMSDYGKTAGLPDATKGGQSPHTHHIKLKNKTITKNMDGCPTVSPATLTGFQMNGTVSLITGNGTNAPFENPDGPPVSTLQVCITGGDKVPYSVTHSNISLVFGSPADTHFGSQAIHGVVRNATVDLIEKDRELPR